jgi:hypothetical protein
MDIIRAWQDIDYRNNLSAAARAARAIHRAAGVGRPVTTE